MRKINILSSEYEKLEIHIPIEKLNGHSLNEVFKDNEYPLTDTDKTDLGIQDLDIYFLDYYHRMFRYLKYEEKETGYIYTDDGASKLDVAYTNKTIDERFYELNELSLKEVFEDGLLTNLTAAYNGDGTALNAVDGEEFYFIILKGATSILNYAFEDLNSIGQVVIPTSVTSIGGSAFRNWASNNQPLTIPNSVTSIGYAAFYYWSSNNQPLTIPTSVTSIGYAAFKYWSSATAFIMERTTPPTIGNEAFDNSNDAPIYVPDESVTAYKTATNWTAYADRIFALSERVI